MLFADTIQTASNGPVSMVVGLWLDGGVDDGTCLFIEIRLDISTFELPVQSFPFS